LIEAGNGITYCQVLNWSLLLSVLKLARVLWSLSMLEKQLLVSTMFTRCYQLYSCCNLSSYTCCLF
jgi:hypothetical protein